MAHLIINLCKLPGAVTRMLHLFGCLNTLYAENCVLGGWIAIWPFIQDR